MLMPQFIISLILSYVKNNRVKCECEVKFFIFLNNRNINNKSF